MLLKREGHAVNKKRIQRLYREEKLTVRRRGGRKRAIGTRRPLEVPLAPNQRCTHPVSTAAYKANWRTF